MAEIRRGVDEAGGRALANQKRDVYLQIVPEMVVPLKGEGFKVESAAEEKVGGKPAAVLKVTGPDGKEFQLFFDKESGLPVKLTATVAGFQGERVRPGNDLRQLQGFRRDQTGHQDRDQAQRQEIRRAGDHRVQSARQGRAQDICRAVTPAEPAEPRPRC